MRARIQTNPQGCKPVGEAREAHCPIEQGMRTLGGKWAGSAVWHLKGEPVCFNDLARMVGGASKKTIIEPPRQLDSWGPIERRALDTSPVAVEYVITPFGATTLVCLGQLRGWLESPPEELQAEASQ